MKRFFTSEAWARILSLIIAVGLWLFVTIFINPETEVFIKGIPIIFSDYSVLADNNLVMLNNSSMTVNITIRGNRRTLSQLNEDSIKAIVDFSEFTRPGEIYLPVNIELPNDDLVVVDRNPNNVIIKVDNVIEMQKSVVVSLEGVPRSGYVAVSPTSSVAEVTVRGPEAVVKLIDKVSASLDVSRASSDVSMLQRVIFLSANDVQLIDEHITAKPDIVTVSCTILKQKFVPIVINLSGSPPPDVTVNAVVALGNDVEIWGKADVLDAVEYIETMPIDISKVNTSGQTEIKLITPENITLPVDSVLINLTVTKN